MFTHEQKCNVSSNFNAFSPWEQKPKASRQMKRLFDVVFQQVCLGYRDVPAKEEFKMEFSLMPRTTREHVVVFSFDCKTLKDITGSASIEIAK